MSGVSTFTMEPTVASSQPGQGPAVDRRQELQQVRMAALYGRIVAYHFGGSLQGDQDVKTPVYFRAGENRILVSPVPSADGSGAGSDRIAIYAIDKNGGAAWLELGKDGKVFNCQGFDRDNRPMTDEQAIIEKVYRAASAPLVKPESKP